MKNVTGFWAPYFVMAPLVDDRTFDKLDFIKRTQNEFGIEEQRAYKLGFSHANCLASETKFLTKEGIKYLGDCVGQKVEILGRDAGWKEAEIKSFGKQPLMKITVGKYNSRREIFATPGHDWFIRKSRDSHRILTVSTMDLKPGYLLKSMFSHTQSTVRISPFGIAQGIVFGDGTRPTTWNHPARVTLCGDKDLNLLKYFPISHTKVVTGVGIDVCDLPRSWKSKPDLTESKSFLYGWLAGYFAADGCVAEDGHVSMASADISNLETVESVCSLLGIATNPISFHMRIGLGKELSPLFSIGMSRKTIREEFFLIPEHRERIVAANLKGTVTELKDYKVISVEATDRFEEVYCAVVPDGHAFTLLGNIFTSNCGLGCVKAGKAHFLHLLDVFPERYAEWEENERDVAEYLQREGKEPFTILRETVKKERRYISLKELRVRAEEIKKTEEGQDEWGACGCFLDASDDELGINLPSETEYQRIARIKKGSK